MKFPIISVIVPVYNVVELLPRCIDSLLNQKFKDYEVVLVDDGSTDGSGKICDEYVRRDSRIKVIHKQNEGVSKTRNRGIDEAHGEWITFVDADDYVTPDYLSDLYDCACNDIDLVVMHSRHVKENGELLYKDYILPKGKIVYRSSDFSSMLKEQFISERGYVHSKMFRKDLVNASSIRFNPEVKFCEDWIFLFSYVNTMDGNICCSPVSNYFYVDRENSLSHAENNFNTEYTTFRTIKDIALAFCMKYRADIVDIGPLYLMHKALTLAISRAQLRSIKSEDWAFFNRYYRATSMKTACDKWMVRYFYPFPSVLYVYFCLSRNFRKMLERHNLWSIVNILRK